ncbi:MAG: T9SS type A sorting domain-containing protein [Bacteroidales bacterium]|nr:T9SS type A sorting domain-containing protein [Bacteroidales bacterium]
MKTITLSFGFLLSTIFLMGQNNCLDFDGNNKYSITQNFYSEFNGTSRTIELWFYAESAGVILSEQGNTTLDFGWFDSQIEILATGEVRVAVWNVGSGLTENPVGFVSFNTWNHLVLRYNCIGQLDGFLNGIESKTNTAVTISMPSTGELYYAIAGYTVSNMGSNAWFNGKVDEVRLWNDVRTEEEIRQNMYRELPNPAGESNLIAYYKFNETSGSTCYDSKNSYNATLTNMTGTEWQTSSAMYGSKNCLEFDATNDYIEVPTLSSPFSQGTISFWIKPKATPTNHARVLSDYWDDDEIYLFSGAGNVATWHMISGDELMSSDPLPNNTWTHVAITMDNTSSKLYINGVLDDESGAADTYISSDFEIGGYSTSGNYEVVNGYLDEFCIWSTVLTQEEIREYMCKNLTGNEANLLLYYSLNNSSGTTVQDFSGNGNDGTLTNMDANTDWVTSSAFNTWLSTNSSDYSTASNWSLGTVPSSTDNIGVYGYSGGEELTFSGTPTINNLFISSTASPVLGSNITVNGNLIMESNVDLNGNTVNLGMDANLIEENGLFYGNSGKIITTRVLNGSITAINENIGGIGAEITCAADMGSTVIERHHSAIGSQSGIDGITRYYVISPANNSGLNATLVFHYDDSELNGNTESGLVLHKSTDAGTTWNEIGGTINTTENTITFSNTDGFSWWTAAQSGTVLPVELISFSGKWVNQSVNLHWETASETNVAYFRVYRSSDNINYEPLTMISAAGNSSQTHHYGLSDQNVQYHTNYYYYLNEMSFDGQEYQCSPTILVRENNSENSNFNVFPNPFDNQIYLESSENIQLLEMYNSSGKEIPVTINFEDNAAKIQPQMTLPTGVYLLKIYTSNGVENHSIIKK